MDVAFEGEERSCHLEGKLVVSKVESASQRQKVLAQIAVNFADLLLDLHLLLHLAAASLLHSLLHRSRLFLQHHLLLRLIVHLDLLLL